jgi:hypothetical protein
MINVAGRYYVDRHKERRIQKHIFGVDFKLGSIQKELK